MCLNRSEGGKGADKMGKAGQALHNLLASLWRAVGSTRLAIILLALLLLTSLLASLLPQLPGDPSVHEPWLAAVELRYRTATSLLHTLGLFDVYHSPWFLILVAALLVNTFLCTLQRLPRLWRSLSRRPIVSQPDAFYHGFARHAEWPIGSLRIGLAAARQTLQHRRYRTFVELDQAGGRAHVYAERYRWSRTGTLLSHLALLLLLTALLARPALAWQQRGLLLFPGRIQPLYRAPALAVEAGSLAIDRHPNGQPRQYRVPLTILVDGALLTTQTVSLNHPLTVRGIAFHLQSYGPAVRLATPEGSFDLAFTNSQTEEVHLTGAGLTLRVAYQPAGDFPDDAAPGPTDDSEHGSIFVEAITESGELLGSGVVPAGQEIVVRGMPLTFSLANYTTWQISHDPTFGLAVAAAALLLAGTLISLWLPRRRLWLRLDGQTMRLVGHASATAWKALTGEIDGTVAPGVDTALSLEGTATHQPKAGFDG
jgi:cytochrome c biogenesis protein